MAATARPGGLLLLPLSQTNDGKIFGTVRRVKYDNIRKIQRNGMKDREKD